MLQIWKNNQSALTLFHRKSEYPKVGILSIDDEKATNPYSAILFFILLNCRFTKYNSQNTLF